MSDYAKIHTKQPAGKAQGQGSNPAGGANQMPGKDHETAIGIAEGLSIGSVHPAHTKHQVHQAKHNAAPVKAGHAQHNRAIAGNADPEGCGVDVANQETGHGPLQSALQNKKVRNKAHGYNERSIAGHANPSAMPDDSEV
jgi:hypothetical protein